LADPKELVKFVNSTIKTTHDPETAKVVQLKTEYIKPRKSGGGKMTYDKVIADMIFSIDDKVYGIEFQTQHDNTILCRIAEYQFNAMIDMVKNTGFSNEYEGELALPRMTMIQLEKSENVPAHYKLWFVNEETGEKISQKFPIIKMWEHTVENLSQNGMHLLLPFKIIDIRKSIKGKEMDSETTARFLEMNAEIDNKITELFYDAGLSYTAMEKMNHAHGSLIRYFNEKFISDTNPRKGEVENMFAEVMDRRNVITKEDILHEGMTQGLQKGLQEGKLEILSDFALSGVPFKTFRSIAEARDVPRERYIPVYGDALEVRKRRGETISPADDDMPFLEAKNQLTKSSKVPGTRSRSKKKDAPGLE